jgi:hypothetical protein
MSLLEGKELYYCLSSEGAKSNTTENRVALLEEEFGDYIFYNNFWQSRPTNSISQSFSLQK